MAQFTNQAQLSYNNSVISSNIAVGEILEVLSGAKTSLTNEYTLGEDVTYVISAVNSGTTAITDLSVTDDLGAYTVGGETLYPLTYTADSVRMYINGVLQPAPVVSAGPPLVFSGITLPADSNLIIAYEAQVNRFAPLDTFGSITNTATVDGNGIPSPITVTETVTPEAAPDLTITKSIQPIPVTENSRVTYTFLVQNYGNTAAEADANAVITDTFDPILTDIIVTFNGTTWAEGTQFTYDETTGLFSTAAGEITVPAATYTTDPETGAVVITPGVSTLTVTGTI